MNVAYWALLSIALVLVVIGLFGHVNWLFFVAVGLILAARLVDPKRSFFGTRKAS